MPQIPFDDLADAIARAFHEHYERLAPTYGWTTQPVSRVPWDQVPAHNRALMRTTVATLLQQGWIDPGTAAVSAVTQHSGEN